MSLHHVLERVVRASRHIIGRHQPGAVLLKKFCELQGTSHRRPPSPGRGLGRSQSALPDGEAGFLLAIQNDIQRMAAGLCAHMLSVQHGPTCSWRAQNLRGHR